MKRIRGNVMLLRTYQKIIEYFKENNGYMSFMELKNKGVTTLQLREMEQEDVVEKFARGWYWCRECGMNKPNDYKYIEIAKAYPKSVVCMESACFLNGILLREPEIPTIATERSGRGKIEMNYPIRRYFLQNTNMEGEIKEITTDFGSYRYYSEERTFCDCIRMKDKLSEGIYIEILDAFKRRKSEKDIIYAYAKRLRALQNLKREEYI